MDNRLSTTLFSALAVVISLSISAALMLAIGTNPVEAYYWLFYGAVLGVGPTLKLATPLILTGLSAAISFKAGYFNVGQEGQLFIGALFGTEAALYSGGLPFPLPLIAGFAMGFVGGAFWALFPALLKAKMNINEIISTLMLNFIAINLVLYLVSGPIQNPGDPNSESAFIGESGLLPTLTSHPTISSAVILAGASVVAIYYLVARTPLGYDIRAVGLNSEASRFAGISPAKVIVVTSLISGGLAGLAGMVQIAAVFHSLSVNISDSYGYVGIAIAALGNSNAIGVLISGFLFAALVSGSTLMQTITHVPSIIVQVIEGIVILAAVGRELLQRLRRP